MHTCCYNKSKYNTINVCNWVECRYLALGISQNDRKFCDFRDRELEEKYGSRDDTLVVEAPDSRVIRDTGRRSVNARGFHM